MPRTPRDVTDTELAILHVLWNEGSVTRRQITDVLYPQGGPAYFTTVQKLLERLEAKGFVARSRGKYGIAFKAKVDRQQLISRRLLDMADKLCGGSLTPLLINLVRAQPVEESDLNELRALVDELSQSSRPKGKPR
jgi:BlaI family transcriptional regulator, penicillinase repressor